MSAMSDLCAIAIPGRTHPCIQPLGHLGRCSWDKTPAVDPQRYQGDGTLNLLKPHGTRSDYRHGCRCAICTKANATYMTEYRAKLLRRMARAR
jgi:hypothetical protein